MVTITFANTKPASGVYFTLNSTYLQSSPDTNSIMFNEYLVICHTIIFRLVDGVTSIGNGTVIGWVSPEIVPYRTVFCSLNNIDVTGLTNSATILIIVPDGRILGYQIKASTNYQNICTSAPVVYVRKINS
jgi:hypothetical protein